MGRLFFFVRELYWEKFLLFFLSWEYVWCLKNNEGVSCGLGWVVGGEIMCLRVDMEGFDKDR